MIHIADNRNQQIINFLPENGALINIEENDLHIATKTGDRDIIKSYMIKINKY